MLLQENAGAVATFSPTGLEVGTGHKYLHRGFMVSLFEDNFWVLGPATTRARLRVFESWNNFQLMNTYTLFGDTALNIKHQNYLYFPLVVK